MSVLTSASFRSMPTMPPLPRARDSVQPHEIEGELAVRGDFFHTQSAYEL